MEAQIILENVSLSFHRKEILRDISLRMNKGGKYAIIGPSGSGKSLLVKAMSGLQCVTNGNIIINNRLNTNSPIKNIRANKIAFSFQNDALFDNMTIEENILFVLENSQQFDQYNNGNNRLSERAMCLLNSIGMEEAKGLYPSEISGGMRKKVSILRTIMLNPEIIIFDEPTTGLDPISTFDICKLIKNTSDMQNITSIVVTHSLQIVNMLSDYVFFLQDGEIIWEGSKELLHNSTSSKVKHFMSISL